MSNSAEPLLSVRGVTVRFGGIVALDGVSFDVKRGDICGLIGPNGAGKTTLFNCLSRLYQYQAGDILFEGKSITNTPTHQIAGLGMGRTFQNLAMFRTHAGARERHGRRALPLVVGLPVQRAAAAAACRPRKQRLRERAGKIMDELGLTPFQDRPVGDLPFGTQKRVEFARALAAEPKLLLLDEPAAGLNHEELGDLARLIRDARDRLGITVLLVEHHMSLVMSVSDHIVALNFGRKIAEGNPAHIQKPPGRDRGLPGGAGQCLSCWK